MERRIFKTCDGMRMTWLDLKKVSALIASAKWDL